MATAADIAAVSVPVPLDGTSGNIVDISARGNSLWCIDSTDKIYQFDSGLGKWQIVPNTGITNGVPRKIAATNEGGAWLSTGVGKDMYKRPKGATAWSNSYCPGCWVFPISAISDKYAVALGWDQPTPHTIGAYPATLTATHKIGQIPGFTADIFNAIWVGIGDKKDHWYIDTQNKIYRYDFNAKRWNSVSANLTGCSVDVQCPDRVVVTSMCGKAYIRSADEWLQLPFKNVKFTTINYDAVYAVTKDGKVFKYEIPGYDCGCADECPVWVMT